MKKTKKLLMFLTACTLTLTTSFVNMPVVTTKADTVTNESPKPVPPTASTQYAAAMEPGWNLGNTYDAINTNPGAVSDETAWGNPMPTKALIDKIKSEGFKSIRMPFTAFTRIGAAPDYKIDPAFLARYAQTVQWAVDDGLYVMINTHHDSWEWTEYYEADDDNGVAKTEFEAIWTQLANYFKNYDSKVCFESTNEIGFCNHSGNVSDDVKNQRMVDLNKDFYNIVRNSGGNNGTRMLILPPIGHTGTTTYCDPVLKTIQDLKDPNIMTSVHSYGSWFFSCNIAGYDSFTEACKSDLRSYYDTSYNEFIKNGIGVVVGEYGMFDNSYTDNEKGDVLQYLEYMVHYAKVDGLTSMLWDRGTDYLDRNTLTWKEPKKIAMIKAAWTGRASYAYSDRIFVKDQNMNSDVNIPLTLNGNTLSSIYNGTTKLVEGQDYNYANSTVTLKGSYVSDLMTARYGTKATLTFKFSSGPDWDADLIRYATPVAGSVTGSTSNFVIPVQFNGSKLKSLEAVKIDNADGHNLWAGVGEFGWSSYKPFDTYKVDYSANTITMTDKFFNGEFDKTLAQFVIRLHFQSGEVQNLLINQADGKLTYTAPVNVVPTAKITVDNSNVIIERNQSATFTVSMNQLANTNAFDVTLKYDNSLYNVSKIEYLVPGLTEVSKSDKDGNLRLVFGKTDKTTITAADYKDLVRVTLTPKSFNVSQDASVQLVKANTATINNNVATDAACILGQASGKATIKLASDINLSGDVTLADLSMALAHYMDDKDSASWSDAQKADINNDGVIDIVDLQLIAGYIK